MKRLFLILLSMLVALTYSRNTVWATNISLWKDATLKSPYKPRPRVNLGWAYHLQGELDLALDSYNTALQLSVFYNSPQLTRLLVGTNIADIYIRRKQWIEAGQLLSTLLSEAPDYRPVAANLIYVYVRLGLIKEGIALADYILSTSINHHFNLADGTIYFNRGAAYQLLGNCLLADADYETATKLDSNIGLAHCITNVE